ncbi:1ed27ea8-744d-4c7a-b5bd-ed4049551cf9 [Sclerotinia trifoliorum]|uniref:1ed27ea8-744d-4c7a-b5bd-ed4049551cf9 n=1 Tax=Sclerotinia trifoliorum TaxID=28548 RepID=A0A8H2W3S5_9HELO|nr:1ed27ea8-744d-4c7a-b5bd-ed4049551cf9 [Sclerotinia trifoliorum]
MPHTHFLRLTHLTRLTRTTIHSKPILPLTHPFTRPITNTPSTQFPRKDSQQKDSINTEATEYSKSGTDDAAAREQSAAFDPNITNPESEKDQAGKGEKKEGYGNPLEVSPANRDVSRQTGEMGGGLRE